MYVMHTATSLSQTFSDVLRLVPNIKAMEDILKLICCWKLKNIYFFKKKGNLQFVRFMLILYKNVYANVGASGFRNNLCVYMHKKGTKGKPTINTCACQLHSNSYTQFAYELISFEKLKHLLQL